MDASRSGRSQTCGDQNWGEVYTSREALNQFLNDAQAAKAKRHGEAVSAGIRRADLERQAKELGV